MATLETLRKQMTPRQQAIRDMREAGLDTTVLELRKTVIVEEIEEFVFRSLDDGRSLNGITSKNAERFLECGGRRVKRTIFSETSRENIKIVKIIKS